MADYRNLEIKVAHARHLKNVNFMSNMEPYVVVSLSCDPRPRLKTPVDRTGNKNPTWNFSIKFVVDVVASRLAHPTLAFSILCERTLGDKTIGDVQVALTDLLDSLDTGKACHVTYQVRRPSGRGKGELSFSYQWGERLSGAPAFPAPSAPPLSVGEKKEEVATAYSLVAGTSSGFHPTGHVPHGGLYPVVGYNSHPSPSYVGYPPPHQYSVYPPPQTYGGYPPPHQYSGYPPPQTYGGYPPPHQYSGYPPAHQYGGYQTPPGPGYGYQARTGYGYPLARPAPEKSNSRLLVREFLL